VFLILTENIHSNNFRLSDICKHKTAFGIHSLRQTKTLREQGRILGAFCPSPAEEWAKRACSPLISAPARTQLFFKFISSHRHIKGGNMTAEIFETDTFETSAGELKITFIGHGRLHFYP
jgi:hypothetical protein